MPPPRQGVKRPFRHPRGIVLSGRYCEMLVLGRGCENLALSSHEGVELIVTVAFLWLQLV